MLQVGLNRQYLNEAKKNGLSNISQYVRFLHKQFFLGELKLAPFEDFYPTECRLNQKTQISISSEFFEDMKKEFRQKGITTTISRYIRWLHFSQTNKK